MALLHLRGLELTFEHRPFTDATAALGWLYPLLSRTPSLSRIALYADPNRYLNLMTDSRSLRQMLSACRRHYRQTMTSP